MNLNSLYTNWKNNGGAFSMLSSVSGYTPPWHSVVSDRSLDLQYHGNHSGRKTVTYLTESFLDDNGALSDTDKVILATIAKETFGEKWAALWRTFHLTYNPIENYNMSETIGREGHNTGTVADVGSDSTNETHTQASTKANTGTVVLDDTVTSASTDSESGTVGNTGTQTNAETVSHGETVNGTSNTTGTNTTGIYGFNSVNAVNSDTQNATGTGTTTEAHSGTDTKNDTRTDNLTQTTTDTKSTTGTVDTDSTTTNDLSETMSATNTLAGTGTKNNTRTDNLTNVESVETNRTGNIGVTTTQQMIEQERQVWLWNYFNQVFSDMDTILTIQLYE